MRPLASLLTAVLTLGMCASAAAATRFVATSGGTAGTCDGSAGNPPCNIAYAFSLQTSGDRYVISTGTYKVALPLNANDLTVEGAPGQARPIITSGGNTLTVNGTGAHLSGLEVQTAGAGPATALSAPAGGTFDHLAIAATGPGGKEGNVEALSTGASAFLTDSGITINENGVSNGAVQINGGTLTMRNVQFDHQDNFESNDVNVTNSSSALAGDGLFFMGSGPGGRAVIGGIAVIGGAATVSHSVVPSIGEFGGSAEVTESVVGNEVHAAVGAEAPGSVTLRDDTLFSTDPGAAAIAAESSSGGATINATNVIAQPGPGAVALKAMAGNTINVDHSSFPSASGTVNDLGGNESSDPQFVAAPNDFHLKASSPALDAGSANGVAPGETDLDGRPRIPPKSVDCRRQVDMGAYELTVHDAPCPPPAPRLTNARESHRVWRLGSRLVSFARKQPAGRPPVGTTFRFTLNEPARVTLTFTQRQGRHTKVRGTLSFAGHAGVNKVFFEGRLSRSRKLGSGSYAVVFSAVNSAGKRSNQLRLSFQIVR